MCTWKNIVIFVSIFVKDRQIVEIMDVEIKTQLIKSVDNIKNKIKKIKNEEDAANLKFKRIFKPLTDNFDTLMKTSEDKDKPILNMSIDMSKNEDAEKDSINTEKYNMNTENLSKLDSSNSSDYYDYSDEEKSTSQNINNTLQSLKKEDVIDIYDSDINIPFGLRRENKGLMMGNSKVSFSVASDSTKSEKNYILTINNKHYSFTPGLKELLMRSKPKLDIVTEKDKLVYKDILHHTNAHKRDFKPTGQIRGDKGVKYRHIIKPLFSEKDNDSSETKSGGYIPMCKKYKSDTDYIFWDDPNELIERLKLLLASQSAGNTNHDNEILSIIEELKEAGIIKN